MKRVVVTGIGAVTPIGNDVESMWKNLIKGKHGIDVIDRFDIDGFENHLAAEVKGYDPLLYMSRKDVNRYDPYTVFGVGAACQAMKNSKIDGTVPKERFGVYFSSVMGGLSAVERGIAALTEKGSSRVSSYTVPAMITNTAAGAIAMKYGCRASCMSISTACASSSNAVGEAYRCIKHGYADAVIAGGADAAITPFGIASLNACNAMSRSDDPDRASIPFDAERDGFVLGEGSGALVLEEYEHAKKRGAYIYGEICGYGSTCDAFNMVAPMPDADMAAKAVKYALQEAEQDFGPTEGGIYINAHGTATRLNDKMETIAIKKGLGLERAYESIVSSTRSMTGHLLGGAGAVEAIISLLVLRRKDIPPTAGYKVEDDMCDLDICANEARHADIELTLSNSFGFGGHNSCIAFRDTE